jgi:hypothetical protein
MEVDMDTINKVIGAARNHGLNGEPDHEVGDLQDMLRFLWNISDPGTQEAFSKSPVVLEFIEKEGSLEEPYLDLWVGVVQVEFSEDGKVYGTETYHIVLEGEEFREEDVRLAKYKSEAMKRAKSSQYDDDRIPDRRIEADILAEWEDSVTEYCSHEECKAVGIHLQSVDDDGYCNFCGEQD